jgi:hypothetical protein
MNRTAALVVGALAIAAVAAPPALAAPKKKTITKSYDVTAAMPDPTNFAGQGYPVCAQNVPGSFDKRTIAIPAAGTIEVEVSGFQGDWDLLLEDADDSELAEGGSNGLGGSETADVRFKKAQKMSIVACNWAGTPNATVKYTFTYK